jgi:putative oxidoreductase
MADSNSPPYPHTVTPRRADLASLLLRAALAGVFIYHGVDKIFGPNDAWGTNWVNVWIRSTLNAPMSSEEPPSALFAAAQAVVAWGELMGGIALILGLLTRPAAGALFLLQAAALYLIVANPNFSYDRRGGFEYNIVIMTMCLALLVLGSGRLALDRVLLRVRRATAHAPASAPLAAGAGR